MTSKRCSGCKKQLPLDSFATDRSRADGKQRTCKKCVRKYRDANRKQLAAYGGAYRKKHKEQHRSYVRKWYERNRRKVIENAARWSKNNRKRSRRIKADWQHRHHDQYLTIMQRNYLKNRTRKLAYHADYREANREICRKRIVDWRKNNPGKVLAITQKRRAALRDAPTGDLASVLQVYKLSASDKIIPCTYCGKETVKGKRDVDHATPIARSGAHAAENLRIACCSCNRSKSKKTAEEFMKWRNSQLRKDFK